MQKKAAVLFLVIIMSFVAVQVFATRITRKTVKCPLCDTEFTAPVVWSSNSFGGMDHDLCPHAMGASPLSSYIWGCPYCHLSGGSEVFSKEYSADEKQELLTWLKTNYPPTIEKPKKSDEEDEYYGSGNPSLSSNMVPDYIRYEIACKLEEKASKDSYQLAQLCLRASWVARHNIMISKGDRHSKFYGTDIFRDSKVIAEEFENVAVRMNPSGNDARWMVNFYYALADAVFKKKQLTDEEKMECLFSFAKMFKASGENVEAEKYLKKLENMKISSDAEEITEAIKAIRNCIELEQSFQKKALSYFNEAMQKGNIEEEQKLESTLLIAELNRLLGNFDEAKKHYLSLLNNENTPEMFIETVKFGMKQMGMEKDISSDVMDSLELSKINQAIQSLLQPYSFENREAPFYLRISKRRDIIYPQLKEIIDSVVSGKFVPVKPMNVFFSGKDRVDESLRMKEEVIKNALMAMSDATDEALKYQTDLLKHGIGVRSILYSLKQNANRLQPQPFIEFLKSEDEDIQNYALIILQIINNDESKKAILKFAAEELASEKLEPLYKKKINYGDTRRVEHIIEALGNVRNKQSAKILADTAEFMLKKEIPEELKKENMHCINDLYKKCGESLETIFFRHFGFSSIYRQGSNKEYRSIIRNEPIEEPLKEFKEWYEKNKKEPYKNIIYAGFKEFGYEVLPENDVKTLDVLMEAFTKERSCVIRNNAYREFTRRTGVIYRPDLGLSMDFLGREEQEFIPFYVNWYDENKDKLKYDETKKRFVIE